MYYSIVWVIGGNELGVTLFHNKCSYKDAFK